MIELALTKEQYDSIMDEIWKNHRWNWEPEDVNKQDCHKYIKYVRPNWDLRDGMCFSIKFNGLIEVEGTKEFHSGYGETISMYDRIMEWLNSSRVWEVET